MKYSSKRPLLYEEYAYILDYLPYGFYAPGRPRSRGPVAQAVGEIYFTLLELIPYEGVELNVRERVYVGKGISDKIMRVSRRLRYEELTARARAELPSVIEEIVSKREREFVEFFNKAQPLTPRMHSLELLRGVGKKTLWRILEERKRNPFNSFKDIEERAKISNVRKLIVERILNEIIDSREKYHLFVPIRGPKYL
ncbi:MAG: hypothetical protein B6U69_01570 [Thermofilum sp. ex4484_15]|nr:MAG: hypothetical protein B6U69_01570 [Thermofilum sp. ex4484_15]